MENKFDEIQKSLKTILTEAVERGAEKAKELVKKRVKTGKDHNEQQFSDYGRSQRRRREKESLQTSYKDLNYSGTLFDNFSEVSRTITSDSATISISFVGPANRRSDQKPATNKQVAEWLTVQEDKRIVGVSMKEKKDIEDAIKRGVIDEIGKITIA